MISPGLPADPRTDPVLSRLPGMRPLPRGAWIVVDAAFAGQMRLRDALVDEPGAVIAGAGSQQAVDELRDVLLSALGGVEGYEVDGGRVTRPDGVRVAAGDLRSLARLTPMDLCLVERGRGGHVLTAGALLFPASWRLSEKVGRPLGGVHAPVESYDAALERRVDRLFDALHPDRPLWRMNALRYDDPALHQPRGEAARREGGERGAWLRCERQCLVKLPRSDAAVFSIQTFVVPWRDAASAVARGA